MERHAKILAVENETTRKFILHVREHEPFELVTVPDGGAIAAALASSVNGDGQRASTFAEQVDVIILDTTLPGAGGVDALKAIRQNPRMRGIKIIMIGTRPGVQDMVDALISGASDYVVKPFAVNELLVRIENQIKRKHEDENRQELEARYQAMMSMAEGVIMHAASGVVLTCNPAATRLLGISDDYLGTHASLAPDWHFVDQDGQPLPDEEIPYLHTVHSGESLNNVVVGLKRGGAESVHTWLSMNTRALFHGDDSQPYAVVSSFSDITDQKNIEDTLRDSEERFRALAEYSTVAIFIIKGEHFIYINPAFERISGYNREELDSMVIWDLIHPSQISQAMERVLNRLMGDNQASNQEYRIVTKSNDIRFVNMSTVRIEIRGETAIMGSAVDITDSKRAESVLWDIRLTNNLGMLAAGVAGEVHDPILVASAAIDHLKEKTDAFAHKVLAGTYQKEDIHAFLRTVAETETMASRKLARVNEILGSFKQFSRNHALLEKRTFDFGEYVQEILCSLKGQLDEDDVKISVNCPPGVLLNSFPDAFMQIFNNLISNSLLHGFRTTGKGNINIDVYPKDDVLYIQYRDDGAGMTEKQVQNIFNPFTTRLQDTGGGLGMHIVYSLVTQTLKGKIECSSTPGQGVTFQMGIPL